VVGRFVNLVLGVFVTILVVRSLGDERFGEWSSLLALIALTLAICDLGLRQVAVRRAAADPPTEPAWIGALVQLRFLLSLVAFALSVVVVLVIATDAEMRDAGLVLSATLLLAALGGLRAILQLRVRNDLDIAVITLNSVVWGAAVVVVFTTDGGLVELALGFLLALVASDVLLVIVALRHGRVQLRRVGDRWPEMLRTGIPIAIGSALVLSYGRIDQILVLELAGASDAGLYGAAYRIFDQSQFVAVSVTTTMFPLLAASYAADVARYRLLLQTSTEVLLAAVLGGLAFVAASGEELVVLLFGSEFGPTSDALTLLIAALVPVSFGYLLGMLVILTGSQSRFVIVASLGLLLNVTLNLVLLPSYGFIAAAWATLATEVLVAGMTWFLVRGKSPAMPTWGRIPRIAAAAVGGFGLVALLEAFDVQVVASLVIFGVYYAVALQQLGAIDSLRLLRASR
jgi:O-antigen/teichoic acid export membrane protein